MSVLCKAVVLLLLALPAVAQSQTFDAISIKPAPSDDPANMRMQVLPPGGLNASAVPVLLLVRYVRRAGQPLAASFRSSWLARDVRYRGEGARQRCSPRSFRERKASPDAANDSRVARRSFQARDAG